MKPRLMHRNRDFVLNPQAAIDASELVQDLELETLLSCMSRGDGFLLNAVTSALLSSLQGTGEIVYRQEVLRDCIEHPRVLRELYDIAVDAGEQHRKVWGWLSTKYPEGMLHRSRELLQAFLGLLQRLKLTAAQHQSRFHSEGFRKLFAMLARELDDEFVANVENHLRVLAFPRGVLMSAGLGEGNRIANLSMLNTPELRETWLARIQKRWLQFRRPDRSSYTYDLDARDEAGFRALSNVKNRAMAPLAVVLAQATDHIVGFFGLLRLELAFYVACVNLYESVAQLGNPVAFPVPLPPTDAALQADGVYDICLSLASSEKVVGNDIGSEGKIVHVITGANRGGKSTFLRSLGLGQLMMQSGMFVAAKSFRASVCQGIYTHFKRQEDSSMERGKLEEELNRMSHIVDKVGPYSMVMMNESIASTNEREGSAIARQILTAFREMRVRVFYVTHMYELADDLRRTNTGDVLFLRAERTSDGRRSFRITPGEPLPTSYGLDLYEELFG